MPGPFAEGERLRLTELFATAAQGEADLMLAKGSPRRREIGALVAGEGPLRQLPRLLLVAV